MSVRVLASENHQTVLMVGLYVFQHFLDNSVQINIIYANSTSAPTLTLIFVHGHRFLLPFVLPGIQINIE